MTLEERVTSAIRSHTDLLDPYAPDLTTIRSGARTQSRRRIALGAGVALLAAAALLGPGLVGDGADRSLPPADEQPFPRVTMTTIPDQRDEQLVVEPGITSTMVPGEERVGSVSTEDPGYDGGGVLVLPLPERGEVRWSASCSGAPDSWYVLVIEPNAINYRSGRCDGTSETSLGFEPVSRPGPTLRMFVTDENPREFRRCFFYSPPEGCADLEQVAAGSPASMELTAHVWNPGPTGFTLFGRDFPLRRASASSYVDGPDIYSLVVAAAAATGGRELSFTLEPSEYERIVQAFGPPTPEAFECADMGACAPTVELLVDGEAVEDQFEGPFSGRGGWGRLAPGAPHEITFRVTEGDPALVDLGVVVYEIDP